MKIRTIKYIIKEGISNTYKNKLMTLASVSIVTASLIVFGVFLLFIINLNYNASTLKEQPEMRVFCEYELDSAQISQVEKELKQIQNIESVSLVTPKEAFEKFKETLGEDADVLEGFDESLVAASFIIKLVDPDKSSDTIEEIEKINGVRKVSYSKEVVEFVSKLAHWVRMISGLLIVVLLIISMFIISNTIKLTVFARRREINIMKYIGATDWFIRWPFIVEGVIIGVVGSLIAFLLTRYGYNTVEVRFNGDLQSISRDFIRLVKTQDVSSRLIASYVLIGSVVGAVGSLISIRKYLRV